MIKKKDIADFQDIKMLVDTFYTKIRNHDVLAPIFHERIGERWPEHLDKMYRFWQTVLLDEHTYSGSPFAPHANLPVNALHFDAWKQLFNATINDLFVGENAEIAKFRAATMAQLFLSKIEYSRNNSFKSIQ